MSDYQMDELSRYVIAKRAVEKTVAKNGMVRQGFIMIRSLVSEAPEWPLPAIEAPEIQIALILAKLCR